MKNQYTAYGYYITSEPGFQNARYGVTPELEAQFEPLFNATQNKKDGKIIERLTALIEKYPKIPALKNYLSSAFHVRGNIEKAREVNAWVLAEHPDYLFARVNEAHKLIEEGKLDQVPALLGEAMEIKSLYPGRELFHISEVATFYRCAVRYFVACGNKELAENRFQILRELAPDHPDTWEAEKYLTTSPTGYANWLANIQSTMNSVEKLKEKRKPKHKKAPNFYHPEINLLYEIGIDISETTLLQILDLPRETLTKDLEKVLEDVVERFDYFVEQPWEEANTHAALHALFLLMELNAVDSLPKVLSFLSSDEDVLGFWIGDHITETLWQSIYALGFNATDALGEFLLAPEVHTFCKTAVSETLAQIALHHPERREEIINVFNSVFNEFVNTGPDDPLLDDTFIGLSISDTIDCGFIELLPLIKKLHELDYVDMSINGTYADVINEFERYSKHNYKRELFSIFELYDHVLTTWAGYNEDDDDEEDFDDLDLPIFPTPQSLSSPKIGRNDPCPCGSGKKYKKCCGNG